MPTEDDPLPVGLLLSGGLDSAILLGRLLEQGRSVQPFFVRSGLMWEGEELAAAGRFADAMRCGLSHSRDRVRELVVLDLPLSDLYGKHWSLTGQGTPEADTPDEAVYLPGRNPLLIVKAAVWCQLHGIEELALAVLGSNPFGDATGDFFASFEHALELAGKRPIRVVRPFARKSKREVMQLGRGLPLELTFSCIAPVEGLHCGRCNKCAERRAAFGLIGAADPTAYATPLTNRST
jgi:7-cyano-7-deazaguanine synthase